MCAPQNERVRGPQDKRVLDRRRSEVTLKPDTQLTAGEPISGKSALPISTRSSTAAFATSMAVMSSLAVSQASRTHVVQIRLID